ncbi:hypothetical protein [Alteromonas sp. RKMC-009]|uniref:hypothetical protein n=1 Tax=Alteromonas sp. RKMC-009 TaxID=2267264 RepID=UPI000E688C5C|nr:hypothetical protein [Alteromonas sp. RKMC-009]AYA63864.1 hypothetical protein DS731_07525 [Alteromonas sp. RKMC-009]
MIELKACGWCGSPAHKYFSHLHENRVTCSNKECAVRGISFTRDKWQAERPAEAKIKAKGVREAIEAAYSDNVADTKGEYYVISYFEGYANKLEKGDV